ncbi:Protein of unknown function [Cotesia congregata]|uniref:Uncharacterized protein n=1 Tax=Cotesia congregata TaxID=51543 RepID=A0A8J2MR09_COTCN|nr:Protein of unknown function [Cotesia congregata]
MAVESSAVRVTSSIPESAEGLVFASVKLGAVTFAVAGVAVSKSDSEVESSFVEPVLSVVPSTLDSEGFSVGLPSAVVPSVVELEAAFSVESLTAVRFAFNLSSEDVGSTISPAVIAVGSIVEFKPGVILSGVGVAVELSWGVFCSSVELVERVVLVELSARIGVVASVELSLGVVPFVEFRPGCIVPSVELRLGVNSVELPPGIVVASVELSQGVVPFVEFRPGCIVPSVELRLGVNSVELPPGIVVASVELSLGVVPPVELPTRVELSAVEFLSRVVPSKVELSGKLGLVPSTFSVELPSGLVIPSAKLVASVVASSVELPPGVVPSFPSDPTPVNVELSLVAFAGNAVLLQVGFAGDVVLSLVASKEVTFVSGASDNVVLLSAGSIDDTVELSMVPFAGTVELSAVVVPFINPPVVSVKLDAGVVVELPSVLLDTAVAVADDEALAKELAEELRSDTLNSFSRGITPGGVGVASSEDYRYICVFNLLRPPSCIFRNNLKGHLSFITQGFVLPEREGCSTFKI